MSSRLFRRERRDADWLPATGYAIQQTAPANTATCHRHFVIRSLQTSDGYDLDTTQTVAVLFAGVSKPEDLSIVAVQARVDRFASIPFTSALRPSFAHQRHRALAQEHNVSPPRFDNPDRPLTSVESEDPTAHDKSGTNEDTDFTGKHTAFSSSPAVRRTSSPELRASVGNTDAQQKHQPSPRAEDRGNAHNGRNRAGTITSQIVDSDEEAVHAQLSFESQQEFTTCAFEEEEVEPTEPAPYHETCASTEVQASHAIVEESPVHELSSSGSKSKWSEKEDLALIAAHKRGLSFTLIQQDYFADRSVDACRKRFRRLEPTIVAGTTAKPQPVTVEADLVQDPVQRRSLEADRSPSEVDNGPQLPEPVDHIMDVDDGPQLPKAARRHQNREAKLEEKRARQRASSNQRMEKVATSAKRKRANEERAREKEEKLEQLYKRHKSQEAADKRQEAWKQRLIEKETQLRLSSVDSVNRTPDYLQSLMLPPASDKSRASSQLRRSVSFSRRPDYLKPVHVPSPSGTEILRRSILKKTKSKSTTTDPDASQEVLHSSPIARARQNKRQSPEPPSNATPTSAQRPHAQHDASQTSSKSARASKSQSSQPQPRLTWAQRDFPYLGSYGEMPIGYRQTTLPFAKASRKGKERALDPLPSTSLDDDPLPTLSTPSASDLRSPPARSPYVKPKLQATSTSLVEQPSTSTLRPTSAAGSTAATSIVLSEDESSSSDPDSDSDSSLEEPLMVVRARSQTSASERATTDSQMVVNDDTAAHDSDDDARSEIVSEVDYAPPSPESLPAGLNATATGPDKSTMKSADLALHAKEGEKASARVAEAKSPPQPQPQPGLTLGLNPHVETSLLSEVEVEETLGQPIVTLKSNASRGTANHAANNTAAIKTEPEDDALPTVPPPSTMASLKKRPARGLRRTEIIIGNNPKVRLEALLPDADDSDETEMSVSSDGVELELEDEAVTRQNIYTVRYGVLLVDTDEDRDFESPEGEFEDTDSDVDMDTTEVRAANLQALRTDFFPSEDEADGDWHTPQITPTPSPVLGEARQLVDAWLDVQASEEADNEKERADDSDSDDQSFHSTMASPTSPPNKHTAIASPPTQRAPPSTASFSPERQAPPVRQAPKPSAPPLRTEPLGKSRHLTATSPVAEMQAYADRLPPPFHLARPTLITQMIDNRVPPIGSDGRPVILDYTKRDALEKAAAEAGRKSVLAAMGRDASGFSPVRQDAFRAAGSSLPLVEEGSGRRGTSSSSSSSSSDSSTEASESEDGGPPKKPRKRDPDPVRRRLARLMLSTLR